MAEATNNTSTPPDISSSTPDLSAMSQPGAGAPQPSIMGTQEMQGAIQGENTALQNAAKLAQPTPAAPPPPHARLLAMVQGLSLGLSAAGTAIATHGKEGGAAEVAQVQGQQQQQKIQAQQAAAAQKNNQIQQQLMVADTNDKLARNILFMSTMPNEIAKSNLEVAGKTEELEENKAGFAASHGGMTAEQFNSALSGSAPASGTPNSFFTTNAQQQLGAATKILGADDPYVQKLQGILADPKASPKDLWTATSQIQNQLGLQEKATDAQLKKSQASEAAPLGAKADALNDALLKRYQVSNPKATELPDGFKLDASSTPKDFDRVDKIMQQSENAQSTQASRDLSNATREATLALLKGPSNVDPSATGQAYLDQVKASDPGTANMIQGYADGRLELSPAATRTPQGQALVKQIVRAYPDYDQSNASAYVTMRKSFTGGPVSVGLNSYNTSINHLGEMYDIVSKASPLELNNPASKARQQLDTDQNFISGELAKAISNGQMTEGEKDEMEAAINGKVLGIAGADKYKTQIKEALKLMAGKMDGYNHQWSAGMAKGVKPFDTLSDSAKATIAHISSDGQSSGKAVSLAAARQLPAMKGMTDDQIKAAIQAQGHQVTQ